MGCSSRHWAQKGGPTERRQCRQGINLRNRSLRLHSSSCCQTNFIATTLNLILALSLLRERTCEHESITKPHENVSPQHRLPTQTNLLQFAVHRTSHDSCYPFSTLITPPCVPLVSTWFLDDMDGGMTPVALTSGASLTPAIP